MNIFTKITISSWIMAIIILISAITCVEQGLLTETIFYYIIVGCIVIVISINTANLFIRKFLFEERWRL